MPLSLAAVPRAAEDEAIVRDEVDTEDRPLPYETPRVVDRQLVHLVLNANVIVPTPGMNDGFKWETSSAAACPALPLKEPRRAEFGFGIKAEARAKPHSPPSLRQTANPFYKQIIGHPPHMQTSSQTSTIAVRSDEAFKRKSWMAVVVACVRWRGVLAAALRRSGFRVAAVGRPPPPIPAIPAMTDRAPEHQHQQTQRGTLPLAAPCHTRQPQLGPAAPPVIKWPRARALLTPTTHPPQHRLWQRYSSDLPHRCTNTPT